MADMESQIRAARPEEAEAITTLMRDSKAYWEYDAEFMQAASEEVSVSPDYLRQHAGFVLESDGEMLGFCSLEDRGEALLLENLFIRPEAIGQGWGQRLWDFSVAYGRERRYQAIILVADPNAAGFYIKQGAAVTGETPSGVRAGRMLPTMRFELENKGTDDAN
jgi:GNAT superfamily N-acetyltransferase